MGLTAERCVQRWPAVKEGQTVIDYCWDHRKPKAGEYNEQLVGREEVKESLKGIEKEAGRVQTKHFHEFASGFSYLEEDSGFSFRLNVNCKVGLI